jgi:hypothetical protein
MRDDDFREIKGLATGCGLGLAVWAAIIYAIRFYLS